MISLIVAVDRNGGIGKDNQLVWNIKNDMQWFKLNTMGKSVIMGRKTFESIGKPLRDRTNIVLSSTMKPINEHGVYVEKNADTFFDKLKRFDHIAYREFVVIGGKQIYEKALPHVERIYLTEVHGSFDCDTYLSLDSIRQDFKTKFKSEGVIDENSPFLHTFKVLEK